jgi:trimeric autotransporter adhesin
VDDAGNLFISEAGYGGLRRISRDGTISSVMLSNTAFPQFGLITAVTVDRTGNVFVAGYTCDDNDYYCSLSIRKISPAGTITFIAASANPPGPTGDGVRDGGPAGRAELGFVSNLAVDLAGNLFLTDLHGQRIRKIDLNGIITTVGGNGIPSYSGDGGPATNATLNYPLGLAADGAGNIYTSDFNQAVRVLRPAAAVK